VGAGAGLSSRSRPRDPARRRRWGAAALLAFVAFSGLQCVQDLIVSPPHTTYVFSLNPDSAVVNVGDTVAPFTGTLTADGRAVGFTLDFSMLEQARVARVDSLGRLVILDRGVARLRVRPLSVALPVDTIADTVTIWAVVPRVGLLAARTADTLVSLGDTFQIDAAGLTRGGVPILNVPFRWRQQSGQAAVTLLDSTTGRVRAEANGEAEFLIATDTATARRVVRVVQRPTTLINTADTVRLRAVGQTRSLGATFRDARANTVTNLTATWLSKNTGIATVSGGQISAVGEGTTYVIASYSGGGVSLADTTTVVVQQARLSLLSGNAQTGVVGAALAAPFVVQLVDGAGAAIRDSGVAVVFGVPSGGGHFGVATDTLRTADTVRTDLQGQARTTATLGRLVGANAFSASGPGLAGAALAFAATATPAPLKTFLADSGTGQSGTVGQPLGRAFVVVARDTFGNAVSGVPVRFVVRSGGGKLYGTLDSVDATTDAAGRMRAILTLGHAAGPNEVEATAFVAGGPYQRFTATGTPGPARRLAFTVQPGTIVAGGSFVPAVQVTVRDTFANRVTGATSSVTLSIAAGTGTAGAALGGTKTVAAADAVASFGVVTVDKSGTGFRLVATADGLGPDTSAAFNVSASSADHMVFLAPPRGARAGAPVYPPVQVAVVDASGNSLTSFTGDVTLSIGRVPATGSDRYFGTPVVAAVAGVATFSDFGIQVAAPGYKLRAATPGLVAILSELFDVSGPPATLQMVSGNNQGGIVNAVLADSLVVRVLDAGSYPVPGDTVVFRVTFGDGRFAGADSVVALTGVGGRATAALRLGPTTGSDTVVVRSRSLAGQTVVFAATAVEAGYRLEFVTPPDAIDLGSSFSPAVQVRVRDGFGTTVTGATAVITLAVAAGTGAAGATLTGTTAVAAAAGVATFAGVGASRSGTGYRLTASATGITPATSTAFVVRQVPASLVKDWGDLQNGTVGTSLNDNFVTRVLDAAGDPVAGDTVIYRVTAGPGSFGGVDSAVTVTDNAGRALAGLILGALPGTVTVSVRSTRLAAQTVTYTASATAAGRALEFVTQPASLAAGTTFTPAVQVRVYDPETGTTDATAATLIRVVPYAVVLTGALEADGSIVVAAVNGVATFSGLGVVGPVGTNKRLVASAQGFAANAGSAEFEVTVGAPARMAFEFSHTAQFAGDNFMQYVRILDAAGNLVTTANHQVTLSLTGGTPGAHLRGTLTVNAVEGVARFSDLSIDSVGSGYALSATASGLTSVVGSSFVITPSSPHHLAFGVSPSTVTAGAVMNQVSVFVLDSLGNWSDQVGMAVTLTLGANPGGGGLLGTTTAPVVGGVAAFADLRLRLPGAGYTLVATIPSLPDVTSAPFDVLTGPASRLAFVVQPTTALLGEVITPAVRVAVQDSVGNRIISSAVGITLAITSGTGGAGASLAGTATENAANGLATFSDLSIATYGGGYTLTAMSSGLASAASNPFDILSATSNRLVVTAAPTSANAGAPFAVSVEIRNAAGVKVATATDAVTLSITGGTGTAGAHLRGTLTVAASAGVADFQGVSVDSVGEGYTLTASASGLFSGASPALAIQLAGPDHIAFRVQPTSRTAGNVFSPAIQVMVLDSVGNLHVYALGYVTLGISPGTGADGATLAGTTSVLVAGGTATFADLSIAKAGTGYSLTASYAPALTAVSTTFSIVPGPPASVSVTGPGTFYSQGRQPATAEVRDAWGNTLAGYPVTWNTLNPNVAIAGYGDGIITALNAGQTVLQVDAGGVKGYALVTVAVPSAQGRVTLWRRVSAPGTSRILDVWAYSPSLAFAAGEHGSLLRYDGSAWTAQESGTTSWLHGVWGADTNDVFVVGGGIALRYTGGTWAPVAIPGGDWRGVWGSGPRDVFAVGMGGKVARFDGTAWALMAQAATTAHLFGVWGTSASDVFAVGNNGTVIHYDGSAWTALSTGATSDYLWDVTGTGPGDVLAGGAGGMSRRFNGVNWSTENTNLNLQGVWASAADENYAVTGGGGPIAEYATGSWRLVPVPGLPASSFMNNIAGVPGGGAWAVGGADGEPIVLQGYRGATVAVTPASLTLTALGATQQLTATARDAAANAVAGVTFTWSSADPGVVTVDPATGVVTAVANGTATITATVSGGASGSTLVGVSQMVRSASLSVRSASFFAGNTGTFTVSTFDSLGSRVVGRAVSWRIYDGNVAAFSPQPGANDATVDVLGVAAGQTTLLVVVDGLASAIAVLNVTANVPTTTNLWALEANPTGEPLLGIANHGPTVFAVGDGGSVLRFQGSSWSRVTTLPGKLRGLWVPDPSTVWIAGSAGICRLEESSCAATRSGWFNSIWGAGPDDAWAVGESTGEQIVHWDGAAWTTSEANTGGYALRSVWGFGPLGMGPVYAAGDGATLLHYDGRAWVPINTGLPPSVSLRGVWGDGPTNVWVGTSDGRALHYDGSTWSTMQVTSGSAVHAIWGAAGGEVYAVGAEGGATYVYDGSSWTKQGNGASTQTEGRHDGLRGGGGFGPWATNNLGQIVRGYRGATVAVTPATPTLTALGATQQLAAEARDASGTAVSGVTFTWASDNPGAVTVDANGVVTAVANGTAAITATAPGGAAGSTTVTVSQVAATITMPPDYVSGSGITWEPSAGAVDANGHGIAAPTFVWESLNPAVATVNASTGLVTLVGLGQAVIVARAGSATGYATVHVADWFSPVNLWAPMANPAGGDLTHVWGLSRSSVYAVGGAGLVLHYDGVAWSQMASGTTDNLRSVGGLADSLVWAGSHQGSLLRFNGSNWTREPDPGFSVEAIWGRSPREVYVVGNGGSVRRYDGTAWPPVASGTSQPLLGAYQAIGPLFAVGEAGTIVRDWVPEAAGLTTANLEALWGQPRIGGEPSHLWAVGTGGTILRWDEGSWSAVTSGTIANLSSVTGTLAYRDVYAVGEGGAILRYDGAAWAPMTSGTTANLSAAWTAPDGDVYAVGAGGTILRGLRNAAVSVTPSNPTITGISNTQQLTATARDAASNPVSGVTFTWTSGNESVATVSATGLVTAVAAGTATITATAPGGASGSTTVSVAP